MGIGWQLATTLALWQWCYIIVGHIDPDWAWAQPSPWNIVYFTLGALGAMGLAVLPCIALLLLAWRFLCRLSGAR